MPATDEAIVLAGGLGKRLRGVIDGIPKPLAQVAGRPFLAWVLDYLAAQGLRCAVLATGYLGDKVEATCGPAWHGMKLLYSREREPLGTGGAIALALGMIERETCFVVNGDTWLELDYARLDRSADRNDWLADISVALAMVADVGRYGAVQLEGGCVTGFAEKECSGKGYINAGIYRIRRSLADAFPSASTFSFERDILMPLATSRSVAGYTDTANFIDIGVPEDYLRAQAMFASKSNSKS